MPLTRRSLLTAAAAAPALASVASVGPAQAAAPQAVPGAAPLAGPAPAAVPAGPGLPPGYRFSLKDEPVDLLGREIPLHYTRVHQQAAFDPVTGLLYAVQGISGGVKLSADDTIVSLADHDGRGDLCVNQIAPDGTVLAVMHLKGFGHGAGFGVENVDGTVWLWLETHADVAAPGKNAHGKYIGRLAFQPGALVDAKTGPVELFKPVGENSSVTPSLDLDHGHIAVRHVTGSVAEYSVYELDAFKRREFTPLVRFQGRHSIQSWCLYGNFVYQNSGTAYDVDNPYPGNAWWNVYDVASGAVVERIFNDTALDLAHRESEAITVRRTTAGPQLVFGFATQGDRRMALYGLSSTTPWTPLTYDENVYGATNSYKPQYRQTGDRVELRLRVTRNTNTPWTSGETILSLPSHLHPIRTQGMVGTATGAGDITGPLTVRWEVTPDGSLRIYDERGFKGWIALDAGYFTS
ncbi:signaling protein [Streptomyces sp. NPDC056264]|uniref:phage baseplate protein n=1 Tax=Streptomyces sp. NPDC056264 TaxID=3345767 RepID=UPI003AAEFC85